MTSIPTKSTTISWIDQLSCELSREHPSLGLKLTEIQALNPLLYISITQEEKILPSLLRHPTIFHLNTSRDQPHRVWLTKQCACPHISSSVDIATAAKDLELESKKILIARSDRLQRRRQRKNKEQRIDAAAPPPKPAAVSWLLTAVRRNMYYWMRQTPAGAAMNCIDPAVEPMSPEWCRLVLPMFINFLLVRDQVFSMNDSMELVEEEEEEEEEEEDKDKDKDTDKDTDKDKSMPSKQATRTVLLRTAVDQQHTNTEECCNNSLAALSDIQRATLLKLGRRTVNAVAAYQLQSPLDKEGLDVKRMLRQDPGLRSLVAPDVPLVHALQMARDAILSSSSSSQECFAVYSNVERNGKWFVRMDPSKSSSNSTTTTTPTKQISSSSSNSFVQSLTMDEEGAYSVTGKKAARIMANLLHQAWREVVLTNDKKELTSTCFDLSAGVGGNSFELGKVFDSVVAFELNQERCEMLRLNLQHQGVDSIVTCNCGDSVDALRKLSAASSSSSSSSSSSALAAVLDPPWGGTHYNKSKKRGDILFSGLTMAQFVAEFVKKECLCVLGIKLPLSFNITDDLVDKLSREEGVRMYACKKIFQQRFVVFVAESAH